MPPLSTPMAGKNARPTGNPPQRKVTPYRSEWTERLDRDMGRYLEVDDGRLVEVSGCGLCLLAKDHNLNSNICRDAPYVKLLGREGHLYGVRHTLARVIHVTYI